ncbi:uncharacterized protein [Linepithema humile]|uniref:uncharacterized protein n=1 Tax=Linepithema humile TaxID=83485 RepID=UPI00351F42D0
MIFPRLSLPSSVPASISSCAKVRELMFVLLLLITCVIHANAYEKNGIRNVKNYILDTGLRKVPVERQIFNFKRNGIKIDVKVVPSAKDDSIKIKEEDYFPEFPVKDIGKCILEFSLGCIKKRFVRFLETVGHLDEITLLGQDIKLVKNKVTHRSDGRAMNDTDVNIEQTIDDFFDSFTLRITLPRWDSKRTKNQIDVMMEDTAVAEGRGKKGGGGGGKGGGKCKMMMMGMVMMVKMKLMGLAAMKGMMMGGMSLMLTMMMLSGKFGKGGGGGGGPWQGGGGGQLKEIVLLTKSSGGGGGCSGGGCGGSPPSDSYGAPPPSSYGAPSGGGGGYSGGGGGGGWGRSFNKRPMMLSNDNIIKTETADESNHTPMIGEAVSNMESVDYPDYEDYQEPSPIANPNSVTSNWNATNYIAFHEYKGADVSLMKNNSKVESTVSAKGRTLFNQSPSTTVVNAIEKNVNSLTSMSQPDIIHETNAAYMDEWQATAEKTSSNDASSSNSNARIELHEIDPRSREVPLLRGI